MKTLALAPSPAWRALLCAFFLGLFPATSPGNALLGNPNLRVGECEWQAIYVGWSWSTGWDCVPHTEEGPWRAEDSGGYIHLQEICGGMLVDLWDESGSEYWYVDYCYNFYAWAVSFSN